MCEQKTINLYVHFLITVKEDVSLLINITNPRKVNEE